MAGRVKTLFEILGVDSDTSIVSLATGAPGEKVLKKCADLMREATNKRLVSPTAAPLVEIRGKPNTVSELSEYDYPNSTV